MPVAASLTRENSSKRNPVTVADIITLDNSPMPNFIVSEKNHNSMTDVDSPSKDIPNLVPRPRSSSNSQNYTQLGKHTAIVCENQPQLLDE